MAAAPLVPEVLYAADDLAIGHCGGVCLVLWRARPTLASARELARHYRALANRYPSGFVSFGAIEADVPNPGEAERKAITQAMDAVEHDLRGAAVALESTGFAAAALRAALATMSMLTRSRFPRKFVANVHDAAVWMAPLAPDAGGADSLEAAFVTFRGLVRRPH